MKVLSKDLQKWGIENDWYNTGVLTNEYKLNRDHGKGLKKLMIKLDFQRQNVIAQEIQEKLNNLQKKCRKVDDACRAGCRNDDDLLELDFMRNRAIEKIEDLAELVEMVEEAQAEARNHSVDADEWITVAEATEILRVAKSTVTKWTDKGIFESNGKSGSERRLLKSSVLLVKQEREDEDQKRDDDEVDRDDPRF